MHEEKKRLQKKWITSILLSFWLLFLFYLWWLSFWFLTHTQIQEKTTQQFDSLSSYTIKLHHISLLSSTSYTHIEKKKKYHESNVIKPTFSCNALYYHYHWMAYIIIFEIVCISERNNLPIYLVRKIRGFFDIQNKRQVNQQRIKSIDRKNCWLHQY